MVEIPPPLRCVSGVLESCLRLFPVLLVVLELSSHRGIEFRHSGRVCGFNRFSTFYCRSGPPCLTEVSLVFMTWSKDGRSRTVKTTGVSGLSPRTSVYATVCSTPGTGGTSALKVRGTACEGPLVSTGPVSSIAVTNSRRLKFFSF